MYSNNAMSENVLGLLFLVVKRIFSLPDFSSIRVTKGFFCLGSALTFLMRS
ncbi:099L [Invertebrate iridescent virus Kaz2018]|uniref:099L n=2 Tax=Iridovirus TaxID=10487 RepID=Q91G19_IIV6|nr:099L [Invertebrate iridescent virus 6]AAK82013.1 099L [Invertebrate iridescent virus 6]QMS79468.1 hypothetical protein IIV6-T1_103 [Invertebrate iridescent virus 6]QNH08509.1 099L [Invertebrate iridescent virus Kaz2018]